MSHTDTLVVLTTVANAAEAEALVLALLDRRLIACGTINAPSKSFYRWEGKLAAETETVVMLKTRSACLAALEMAFEELHPYRLPELLALPVESGNAKYLAWLSGETSLAIS